MATSGNEEPTNSSSAERVQPSTKKDKAHRAQSAAQAKLESDSHQEKVEQTNGGRREVTPEAERAKQPLSIHDLRKLARKPGSQ